MSAVERGAEDSPGAGINEPLSAAVENPGRLPLGLTAGVIVTALLPRLIYLFVFSDVQNAGDGMTDTYHHWQIAYLTQQIGLSHGPRLWDLKGLEYFWGVLHPVVLLLAFAITQSIDLVVPRLVSIAFGTMTVVLLFHMARRYWGLQVAVAVALFAALMPPLVFDDALGMVEPLAIALLLLGLYSWPARGFISGVVWAVAAMARAEAWIYSLGLVIGSGVRRTTFERRLPLFIGWTLVMAAYMKLLLDQTGNPIYPLYWEFLVEGTGRWLDPVVSAQAHAVQPLFIGLVMLSLIGLAITLWKRPSSLLLLCYGFGSTAFVMALLGFTPFISSWSGWVWRIRLFSFSLDFAALLTALALLVLLPRIVGRKGLIAGWVINLTLLAGLQLTWIPIQSAYWQTESTWQSTLTAGRTVAALYQQPAYRWGRLNIPADQPSLTYSLVRFGGVGGANVIGQLYDPFYSLPAGYRYDQHPDAATRLLACWLSSTRTSLYVVPLSNKNYVQFVTDHPDWFTELGRIDDHGWLIEGIRSEAVIASACN
jgi:hypothetical protein